VKKGILIFVIVAIALALGFYQERLKISVNYVLENGQRIPGFFDETHQERALLIESHRVYAPFDYYHNHTTETWLYKLNLPQLIRLKWTITAFSLFLFCAINGLIVCKISGQRKLAFGLVMAYGILIALAFGIYAIGQRTGMAESAYAMSRRITGALQSLVPTMIFIPAIWLINLQKRHDENNR